MHGSRWTNRWKLKRVVCPVKVTANPERLGLHDSVWVLCLVSGWHVQLEAANMGGTSTISSRVIFCGTFPKIGIMCVCIYIYVHALMQTRTRVHVHIDMQHLAPSSLKQPKCSTAVMNSQENTWDDQELLGIPRNQTYAPSVSGTCPNLPFHDGTKVNVVAELPEMGGDFKNPLATRRPRHGPCQSLFSSCCDVSCSGHVTSSLTDQSDYRDTGQQETHGRTPCWIHHWHWLPADLGKIPLLTNSVGSWLVCCWWIWR